MALTRRLSRAAAEIVQDERLRMPARLTGVMLLEARGAVTERIGRRRPLRNIYGASMWKAGSQWAKALFDHDIVVSATGLATYPTLVFHSVRDARVPFEEGRLIATSISGARFVPLESNNHLLLESEPAWRRFIAELRAFLPAAEVRDPAFGSLTPRERDLIELIAQGRDNAQIAAQLGVSAKTVRNHITSIFAKLEVENRAQAIVLARKAGFGTAVPGAA